MMLFVYRSNQLRYLPKLYKYLCNDKTMFIDIFFGYFKKNNNIILIPSINILKLSV